MDTHRFEHLTSGLFLPLFALTAILLLMVKVPPWGYEPVQSLNMFSNLPVFAVLYAIWLSLLLFLLWRVGTLWEAALVVSLFVLVHVGAQTLATSFGAAEDWLRGADSVEVQQAGRLDFTSYADYPGLATIGAFLAIVTDVDILALRPPLLLIWLVALSTLLLVGYSRLFGSVRLAALAVLVAIQSNVMLARFSFHPGHVGPLLVVALLGYLSARERPLSASERLVLLLFLASLTITHFVSSMVGILIIAGYYVEQRWRKRPVIVPGGPVILGLTLVLVWAVYWTTQTFSSLVAMVPEVEDRFRQGVAFLYMERLTQANTEGLPLWVTAVQTFWWVAIYLAGGVLALRSLLTRRRLSATPGYAGAYLVVIGAVVIGTVVSTGGYDFYRLLVYGSFLATPLVVHFLLGGSRAKILSLAVLSVFLVLSFPTLLAHNTSVSQLSTHPSEVAAAQLLSRELDERENVTRLFGGPIGPDRVGYYAPDLIPNTVPFPNAEVKEIANKEEGRALWLSHVDDFIDEADQGKEAVFFFDYQNIVYWRHILRLPTDDPLWTGVRQGLSEANLFYDVGGVQLYRSIPQAPKAAQQLPSPGAAQWH